MFYAAYWQDFARPRGRSRIRRTVALLTTIAFTTSFVISSPLQASAQSPSGRHMAARGPAPHKARRTSPSKSLSENLRPLTAEQVRIRGLRPHAVRQIPTVLDETGRLLHDVPAADVTVWKTMLHQRDSSVPWSLQSRAGAATHIKLGEYKLAHDEDPEGALSQFRAASTIAVSALHRVGPSADWQTLKSLAAYDTALTHLLQGHYGPASAEFRSLFARADLQGGFISRNAALLGRHADACAGYHQQRRNAGITEPTRLDPECGSAALAACLRSHGKPFDRKRVNAAVHMTGYGSTLTDAPRDR